MIHTYAVFVNQAAELTATETQAWLGLMHTQALLVRQLDADLEAEHRVSVIGFEVLWRLGAAEGGRVRMTQLAELVLLSPSGLTRLVDRLSAEGLVERVACPSDGRAIHATITLEGRRRLEQARRTLANGIRDRFLAHFSEQEVGQLADFWIRMSPNCS